MRQSLRLGAGALIVAGSLWSLGVMFAPAAGAVRVAPASFSLSTSPSLRPAFNPQVPDYVVACTGSPSTTISVSGATRFSIAGKKFAQSATVSLPLAANQGVEVSVKGAKYTIRCLPADFPSYSAVQNGPPQGTGFLVSLPASGAYYVIAFDAHDVPVWWERQAYATDPQFFKGGSEIGWWTGNLSCGGGCGMGQYVIQTLSGTPVLTVGGSVNPAADIDLHDFQRISGNKFLATQFVPNQPANLSSWGLSSTAPITDGRVVELNAQSQVIWSWSALAHIDPATANVNWRSMYPDVFHINAAQMVGNQVIVSFRHLDAVYDIDAKTGNIIWQLGGVPTSKSLKVIGNSTFDAQAYPQVFSGQHDAKLLPDGTLTVHDNAANELLQSRALRFVIDTQNMTATVLEDVTDANHPGPAFCCGSVQKLPTGDWIVDWGLANYVSELDPLGKTVNQVSFPPASTYRTAPVLATDKQMSNGMNAIVPLLTLG